MTLLALYPDVWHNSNNIANSLNMNPALVRKEIINLKRANFIESKEGKGGGIRLLLNAKKIKLSDIFLAAKGDSNVLAFSSNTPNPSCRVGKQINKNLSIVLNSIDDSIIKELQNISLEEFKNQF